MKKFFVFLTLIFSIAASANVDSFETYQDSIQEGKIEAAYLNMLSSDLREAREAYNAKAENMPEPYDMIEGKIQAAMFIPPSTQSLCQFSRPLYIKTPPNHQIKTRACRTK